MSQRPPPPKAAASAVEIVAGTVRLQGELTLPAQPNGVVLFAHGSGSSRHSPRNAYVAGVLRDAGLGTLLFDLLTATEDRDYAMRFDIPLLTARLVAATHWILRESPAASVPIGYFGASSAPPLRSPPPRSSERGSARWFRAAAVPTWPERRRCRASARPPC